MKVGKASPEEFDMVTGFINVMEDLFGGRSFFSQEESWREWDDDDEDKKLLLEIEKEVKEEYGETVWDGVDNRLILYEFIKRKWRKVNYCGSFGRIVMDAAVLIDDACDPNLDYLEFKPEIMEAINEYNEKRGIENEK